MAKIRISLALSLATLASGFLLAACENPNPHHLPEIVPPPQQLPLQPVILKD